jgi:CNT family concentrative nucleoside transporter
MAHFIPLLGMAVLIGIAMLLSSDRRAIRLRTVGGAFAIQVCVGAVVLFVPWGRQALASVSSLVQKVIDSANVGIQFIFGNLGDKTENWGFIFAVKVLPIIIFFASLISVLYYLRVMQAVIKVLGGALRWALGTSRAESMSATANIFVGQTEAPLVVKPFIPKMTRSELFAIMVGGLASIAGSVMAAYAELGVELKYLIAASFMAAPGGLLFAKLMMPETDQPEDQVQNTNSAADADDIDKPVNVFDAAAFGATNGLKLALNVGAMLLAFVSLIALINMGLGGIGGWFGVPDLSLEMFLGYLFAPVAWLLGVPWSEALQGGSFIGQKIVVNEFVAYLNFTGVQDTLSPLTQAIITFALCGFANLSSIAILLGGLGSLAPSRRPEIARYGLKAVAAASMANMMSAAIAGFFISFTL